MHCSPLRTSVVLAGLALLWGIGTARGEIQSRTVTYEHDGERLHGYLAWDDRGGDGDEKRPGVLVVHEWWGLNDYAQGRARMLAELGYVAFAPDMYGEGQTTEHPQEASQWAGEIRQNVDRWRARAIAGLDVLRTNELVDSDRIAAIGYCFGGATVLQLAYAGEPLRGIVTFHGALPVPGEEEAEKIQPSILICHGAADPFIEEETARELREVLSQAGAEWQMIYYGGAQHSFTNPNVDEKGIEGLAYDRQADERSWRSMRAFFDEVLGE